MDAQRQRRWLITVSLLGIIFVSFIGREDGPAVALEPSTVTPAPAIAQRVPISAYPQIAMIPERLEPRILELSTEDAFGVKSWAPPLPPPPPQPKVVSKPVVAPPPTPVAPPLPYRYLGRLEEEGVKRYFLAAGEQSYSVRPGETIDGNYRLDTAQGNMLTFTYLPLNVQQTLTFETSN